ncbi:hypothetical protein INT43_007262 [Umbelopsis isabellina]|uniref:Pheromone-processing carboxypeptidase KEX1 n=1 Tax=Mortierella isabellina TaxID=91625 RepID=A0A8H7UHW7_MORIS|nr:hypothetical protein INT43_007262 [Umbelopsis isabellina]
MLVSKRTLQRVTCCLLKDYYRHIEVSPEHNANIFFWLLNSQNVKSSNKLIIWLNGGPGCSSMDGMFLENGPYRVNPDLSVNISSGGWQDHANIVFVDQPVGTGFSFADTDSYVKNMTEVGTSFTKFLDLFFEIFPDRAANELYVAGESFAGTYIPYIAHQMLRENEEAGKTKYDLKGLVIGNGWISPRHQYEASFDFAVSRKLLSGSYKNIASQHLDMCRKAIASEELISIYICEQLLTDAIDSSTHIVNRKDNQMLCVNQYDIRMKDEPSPDCGMTWPHELTQVQKYLQDKEVVKAIHASKQMLGWTECSGGVHRALSGDKSVASFYLMPEILEKVPILLFSGEYDLICNSLGTEYLIGNLTWGGSIGFEHNEKFEWHIGDNLAGYYTEERNLTYVLVKDASHMVPYDKPTEMLDMINRFIGVNDGTVNGLHSWIGEKEVTGTPAADPEPKPTTGAGDASDNEGTSEEVEDPWSEYYNWGTSLLVVVILFACVAGFCWYRSSRAGNARLRGRPDFISKLIGKTGLGGRGKGLKLGQDRSDVNELDELVVETPTLFAAEDYSDDDDSNHGRYGRSSREGTRDHLLPNRSNFSIDDDEDD